MNPSERQEYFAQVRKEQRSRHERREGMIFGLLNMIKNENKGTEEEEKENNCYALTTQVVKATSKKIDMVEKAEDESVDVVMNKLLVLAEESKSDAEKIREDLRYQLHEFSAMSLPIPLDDLFLELQTVFSETKHITENLFRSGGELKKNLFLLLESLKSGHHSLMYRDNVDATSALVRLLTTSATLPVVLEPQGRSDLLESLRESSEKMRAASQTKLLKLLPKVVRKVMKLLRCRDIPAAVVEELKESVLLLDPEAEVDVDVSGDATGAPSTHGGGSRPVTASSVSRTTTTTMKKGKKASFVPLIPAERLAEIREGQRRCVVVVFCCLLLFAVVVDYC